MTSQVFSGQIKLSLDLEIKESENIIFHNLRDIATDSKNNIYILDNKEKTIYLFSEDGRFIKKIGRTGQGPGEFIRPCSIYIDPKDIIYVLDASQRRVEIFDSEANHIKSIKFINFPSGSGPNIIVDKSRNFYISGYYRFQNSVIAKFSSTGKLLKYFPIPVIEYEGIKLDDHSQIMVNQYLCGGSMCFDEEERLFFSYDWPYLIKALTKEGKELFQFSGESNFRWTPLIFKTDQINGMLFGGTTRTQKIFFLNNNYLVNSIYAIDWEGNQNIEIKMSDFNNNPEKYFKIRGSFAFLDIYTKEKEFVASTKIDGKVYILCSDKKGRILGVKKDEEDIQTIVRYGVEINRNNSGTWLIHESRLLQMRGVVHEAVVYHRE
jgi:hypothetical protein